MLGGSVKKKEQHLYCCEFQRQKQLIKTKKQTMYLPTKSSMKKCIRIILLFQILISFSSCDKSIETDRIYLSNTEKEFAPYNKGQKVSFVHSNGYNFNFDVTEVDYTFLRDYETPNIIHFDGNYISYQIKSVTMVATYPKLTLKIKIGFLTSKLLTQTSTMQEDFKEIYTDSIKTMNIDLNNNDTWIRYDRNGTFDYKYDNKTYYDSININGKKYLNVIESEFLYHSDSIDSTPKSILYNSTGLLQIKLCNDETFSIK
jgi:hypothetical protein